MDWFCHAFALELPYLDRWPKTVNNPASLTSGSQASHLSTPASHTFCYLRGVLPLRSELALHAVAKLPQVLCPVNCSQEFRPRNCPLLWSWFFCGNQLVPSPCKAANIRHLGRTEHPPDSSPHHPHGHVDQSWRAVELFSFPDLKGFQEQESETGVALESPSKKWISSKKRKNSWNSK